MRTSVNFCQVCGQAMIDQIAYGQLRRVCSDCGFVYFNDPKVAAVAFIVQNDRVLLIRRSVAPEQGKWALPAGYIDYGESPQAATKREVREETGLEIKITHLIDVESSPGAFGASIVIIYAAQVVSGVARPQDDAEAVLWYSAHDPLPELAFESTHKLLHAWIERQRHEH